jgi:hypothetical protein
MRRLLRKAQRALPKWFDRRCVVEDHVSFDQEDGYHFITIRYGDPEQGDIIGRFVVDPARGILLILDRVWQQSLRLAD